MGSPVAVTGTNTTDYSSRFISDKAAYIIYNDSNVVKLGLAKYIMNVKCTGFDQDYTNFEKGWNEAIGKPDGTKVTVTLLDNWTATAVADENIKTSFGSGDGFKGGAILVPASKDITLDLNDFTIDRNLDDETTSRGCVIVNYGKLDIINTDTAADKIGTITGGNTSSGGGGIYNDGELTVEGIKITANKAVGNGGGISNYGTLTVKSCSITENSAANNGGGINNYDTLTLSDSVIITGNTASIGGGIINYDTLTLSDNVNITGNSATNDGGGIYNGNTLTLDDSVSITGNTADYGGGICNTGTVNLNDNVNITGNSATKNGGGIYSNFTITVSGKTLVTGNTKGTGTDAPLNNVYLYNDRTITIDGALDSNAEIGITTEKVPEAGNPIVVTNENTTDYSDRFTSDNTAYKVYYDTADNIIKLKNSDSITFNLNEGSWVDSYTAPAFYTFGKVFTLPTAEKVTKDGYTFDGWHEKADLTDTAVSEISATDSGEKTYYAKWMPNTYIIKYNRNNGIWSGEYEDAYIYGKIFNLPTNITRNGHTFEGWFDNNQFTGSPVATIPANATGNKEYWAKWKLLTYGVSLSSSSVDFGSVMEGYTDAPAAQTITITNNGNSDITAFNVKASGSAYDVSFTTGTITANGGTAAFTVRPKSALAKGTYSETLTITTYPAQAADIKLDVKLSVDNAPTLSASSTNATVGDNVTFTATNVQGAEYKWYSNTTNSTTGGTLIAGAATSSYNPSTANAGVYYYYVTINGTATNVVTLTVNAAAAKPVTTQEKKPEAVSTFRYISGIKDFKLGWNGVKQFITYRMDDGDSKTIEMSSSMKVIPRSVIETLKGKDVTITFISGSDKWTINGKDIKKVSRIDITEMN